MYLGNNFKEFSSSILLFIKDKIFLKQMPALTYPLQLRKPKRSQRLERIRRINQRNNNKRHNREKQHWGSIKTFQEFQIRYSHWVCASKNSSLSHLTLFDHTTNEEESIFHNSLQRRKEASTLALCGLVIVFAEKDQKDDYYVLFTFLKHNLDFVKKFLDEVFMKDFTNPRYTLNSETPFQEFQNLFVEINKNCQGKEIVCSLKLKFSALKNKNNSQSISQDCWNHLLKKLNDYFY